MNRCPVCYQFFGAPAPVKVGDDVEFTFTKNIGRKKQLCGRVGKLLLIKENGFSVVYRGTVYHADEVSSPSDPSPLTLAFVGICEFEGKHP